MARVMVLEVDNGKVRQDFLYDTELGKVIREVIDLDRESVVFRDYIKDNVRVQL